MALDQLPSFPSYSPKCLEKLSEKGYEQRSEREFGRYTEEEIGPWVVCRATLQALSTLFGQFLEVWNSTNFACIGSQKFGCLRGEIGVDLRRAS
jgi:hypothetical protein